MRRLWSLILLCLLLAACGGKSDAPAQASFAPGTAAQSDVLVTVDGREVPAWRYLYWLRRAGERAREQYAAAGRTLDWDAVLPTGDTLADYVKEQALSDAVLYATVENWAERYGCEDAGFDPSDAEALRTAGLSREQAEELAGVRRLYEALFRLCETPGGPLAPAAGELEDFAGREGYLTVDCILLTAGEDGAGAKSRAEALFARLNEAAMSPEIFAALAEEENGEGHLRTFRPGDGALPSALETAARQLEEGACSGILETDTGYALLLRLPLQKGSLLRACFDAQLESAARAAEVIGSEAYETLPVKEYL